MDFIDTQGTRLIGMNRLAEELWIRLEERNNCVSTDLCEHIGLANHLIFQIQTYLIFRLSCSPKIANIVFGVFVCRIIESRIVVRIVVTGVFVFVILTECDGRLLGRCVHRNGWCFWLRFHWRWLTFGNVLCWWTHLVSQWLTCRWLFPERGRIFCRLFCTQFIATGRDVLRICRIQEFFIAGAGDVVRFAAIIVLIIIEIIRLELISLALLLLGQFLFSFILQFIACEVLFIQFGMILAIVLVYSLRMVLTVVQVCGLCGFRLIEVRVRCLRGQSIQPDLLRRSNRYGSRCGWRRRYRRLRWVGEIFRRRAEIVIDLFGHIIVKWFEGCWRIVFLWYERREFFRWWRIVRFGIGRCRCRALAVVLSLQVVILFVRFVLLLGCSRCSRCRGRCRLRGILILIIIVRCRWMRWERLHRTILFRSWRILILCIVFACRQVIIYVIMKTALLFESSGLCEWLLLRAATLFGWCELIFGLCAMALLFVLIETEKILLFEIRRFFVEGFAATKCLLRIRRCRSRNPRCRRSGRTYALIVWKWEEILLLEIRSIVIEAELSVRRLNGGFGWNGRTIVIDKLILIVNQLEVCERTCRLVIIDWIAVVEEAAVGICVRLTAEEIVIWLMVVRTVFIVEWRRHRHNRLRYVWLRRWRHAIEIVVVVHGGVLWSRLVIVLQILLLQWANGGFTAIYCVVAVRLPWELIILSSGICRMHDGRCKWEFEWLASCCFGRGEICIGWRRTRSEGRPHTRGSDTECRRCSIRRWGSICSWCRCGFRRRWIAAELGATSMLVPLSRFLCVAATATIRVTPNVIVIIGIAIAIAVEVRAVRSFEYFVIVCRCEWAKRARLIKRKFSIYESLNIGYSHSL